MCIRDRAEQAQDLLQQHGARVEGIFTHFATADEESDDYFNAQLERFKTILASMKEIPELVHASNSATTLWHAETIFNAVRMGDAMYGLNPVSYTHLDVYKRQPNGCFDR